MAYIGIGYSGDENAFLADFVEKNNDWLTGDRIPRFFGNSFVVLYDSNTAREFAKRCRCEAPAGTITVYRMDKPLVN